MNFRMLECVLDGLKLFLQILRVIVVHSGHVSKIQMFVADIVIHVDDTVLETILQAIRTKFRAE